LSEETLSSAEATPAEKKLAEALDPHPISNERMWAIIREHQSLEARVYEREAVFWWKVASAAIEAINAALKAEESWGGDTLLDEPGVREKFERALKLREEFKLCGSESEESSSGSEPPSSP
jgi:hypothetical protein